MLSVVWQRTGRVPHRRPSASATLARARPVGCGQLRPDRNRRTVGSPSSALWGASNPTPPGLSEGNRRLLAGQDERTAPVSPRSALVWPRTVLKLVQAGTDTGAGRS